ncbi:MAG: hypothetical protein ACTH2B_12775 [Corynebacterium sp.]|uniref:hypothetical protein n=1 Tax=Corynebacterium sp. TaxID=1720 RepID=UPI003F92DEC2
MSNPTGPGPDEEPRNEAQNGPQNEPQGEYQNEFGYGGPSGAQPGAWQPTGPQDLRFAPASYSQYSQYSQYPPYPPAPELESNPLGLVGFILAVVGTVLACIPGIMVVGWVLLPIAFIVSIVAVCLRGRKQGFGITGLVVSVVGALLAVVMFVVVISTVFSDVMDEISDAQDSSEGTLPHSGTPTPDAERGTRTDPLPWGTTVSDGEWEVTINSVDLDANAVVRAENEYSDPAPKGSTYILVNATITYVGDDEDGDMPWTTIEYVTVDGETVTPYDGEHYAVTPDELDTITDLYPGGSTTGNVLLTVPADTAGEGVLTVEPGLMDHRAFVAVNGEGRAAGETRMS